MKSKYNECIEEDKWNMLKVALPYLDNTDKWNYLWKRARQFSRLRVAQVLIENRHASVRPAFSLEDFEHAITIGSLEFLPQELFSKLDQLSKNKLLEHAKKSGSYKAEQTLRQNGAQPHDQAITNLGDSLMQESLQNPSQAESDTTMQEPYNMFYFFNNPVGPLDPNETDIINVFTDYPGL